MTDPKDELGARFDDRRPDAPDDASGTDNTNDSGDAGNTGDSSGADNSSNTSDASDSSGTPGPDPDPDATRNRRQVPMYLPDGKATRLDALYERLDGRSKVAGEGGIEKHADFMEAVVEFAVEHEDELAARVGIGGGESESS